MESVSLTFLIFQGATVIIALVAAAFAWRLDRRLTAMRSGQDGMTKLVAELAETTVRAEGAVRELKQAGGEAGAELEAQIARAKEAAEELRLLSPEDRRRTQRREPRAEPRPAESRAQGFADLLKSTR
ncbi:DUF6468 domain-containing protein [Euryhalocaulis caribicus]|uniref:DUF6468 domain-containing protein n=1 Tax=Euryhalocaulis caribicus TaxID=1161401 RepID=UPI0003AA8DDF|nr:DUF6468 domain-containing protein [Euryhalocaulis caribicus]